MSETIRIIKCSNCQSWEEQPADEARHKVNDFTLLVHLDDNNGIYECDVCKQRVISKLNTDLKETPQQLQWRIATDLSEGLLKTMQHAIANGKIPEDWDGHEIREYLYVLASRERSPLMRNGRKSRPKSFKNTLAITPL